MVFTLTAAQERIREDARSAADEVCAPGAAKRDAERAFPGEEIRRLAGGGWLGMRVDPSRGGRGLDELSAALAVSEFSRACASIGLLLGFHNFLVCEGVDRHATGEARETFLPELARGERLGAVAVFDPLTASAGEDPAEAASTEEGYRLQGIKRFVPGAVGADLFLVYAYAGGRGGGDERSRGRVLLLVPRRTPGLTIGPADPLVGVRASGTASIRFEDSIVPVSHRLGGPGEARAIVKELLASADLVVASQAVGIATASLETVVGRAAEREPGDSLVGSHQSVQFMLADMLVSLEASRLFAQRAAEARARGGGYEYEAAQAKAFAGRAAVQIADAAIQVLGGDGSLADHGIERHWRDAKTCELNPSTRETANLLVARHLIEENR